ncbi:MAG: helix-turn-helix transcriptional regulator [Magnetococcales bacterium]|nr:helix-turn-helix transcriptional regulator [Magnetococcales bacterium]
MNSKSDSFAARLGATMNEQGLTQSELARRVNVRQEAIGRLVRGGGGTKHILEIAKELGVNPWWLHKGIGPKLSGDLLDRELTLQAVKVAAAVLYESGRKMEPDRVVELVSDGVDILTRLQNKSASARETELALQVFIDHHVYK